MSEKNSLRHGRHRCIVTMRGVTLIELMIALTILAVLGVLSYRAVSAATDRESQLSSEFRRWHDIARFFGMAEADLLQIVERPGGTEVGAAVEIAKATDASPVTLTLLRLDGSNGNVQRRSYLLEGGRVILVRWPGSSTSSPSRDAVLEDVADLRFTALGADGSRHDRWPAGGSASPGAFPAAIEIELELKDAGTLRRLFALR